MRKQLRKTPTRRLRVDYRQAAGLLRSDLVWSHDLDQIRIFLADHIEHCERSGNYDSALTLLVQALIAEENDISIGD